MKNAYAIPAPIVKWALDDKFPFHWGALLTIAVVTSRLRMCEKGDRAQYVDLLTELREADTHAHAELVKRYSKTSARPWMIVPAAKRTDTEKQKAEIVASFVRDKISTIPRWKGNVGGLLWAGFSGVSAREIMWKRSGAGWDVGSLQLVHSRRIDIDDAMTPVIRNGMGRRDLVVPSEMPGKFIVHTPSFADEHVTRSGLGRVLAFWMAFKRFAMRDQMGYVERYGKPMPMATWRTSEEENSIASDADIEAAKQLVQDIGRGSQPGWAGPDTIKFELVAHDTSSASGKTIHVGLMEFVNTEISKAVAGGDINTQVRSTGSRALGESQADDAKPLTLLDAEQLDETITNDLVRWIVRLNFGESALANYCPKYRTIVDDDKAEQIASLLDVAKNKLGMRIPAHWAHETLSVPSVEEGDTALGDSVE